MPAKKSQEELSESYKKIQPQSLSPRMKAALRLIHDGWPQADVSAATGYAPTRLSIIINCPLAQDYLDSLDAAVNAKIAETNASFAVSPKKLDIRKKLEEEAETSLQTLLAIRDGCEGDPRLIATVSQDLLDRAGYKSPEKVEVDARVLATQPVIDALNFLRSRKAPKAEVS